MNKVFNHTPIIVPKLVRVDKPGLRYYENPVSKKPFTSITTIISHNSKDKFVDWRKEKGVKEANRITGRSTKRGTKMHTLIESYVGNEERPTVEALFNDKDDNKIENLLNPYNRILAANNKIVIEIMKDREFPVIVNLGCNSKNTYTILTLISNQFEEFTTADGTALTDYNKTIFINCSYQEFVDFCLNQLEDSRLYEETVETYKQLPYKLFNNLRPHLDGIDNILGIEISLFSEFLSIAGTSDCIANYNGKLSIIDYKSSDYIKKKEWITDYFVQAIAYRYMLKELTGLDAEQLVVFMAAENDETKVFIETDFEPYSRKLMQYINKFTNDKSKEIN
jgi:hypothetical protein